MSDEKVQEQEQKSQKPSFTIADINKADGEVTVSISEGFAGLVAEALISFKGWDDKRNPALVSLGSFVRDSMFVLRGEPVERFPRIQKLGVVSNRSAYEDDGQ